MIFNYLNFQTLARNFDYRPQSKKIMNDCFCRKRDNKKNAKFSDIYTKIHERLKPSF